MQENYFIKRQRDLKDSKANESAKTGHAKRALRESMDPTALEGELRKALNNQSIEHCGDAYDEDGNEVSMFGDSTKGTAMAIARYLKGKGFANASIDKDDGAARGDGTAWFAVVRQDSKAKRTYIVQVTTYEEKTTKRTFNSIGDAFKFWDEWKKDADTKTMKMILDKNGKTITIDEWKTKDWGDDNNRIVKKK